MRGHIGAAVLGLICALSLTGCSGASVTSGAATAPARPGDNSSTTSPGASRPTATPPTAATRAHLADATVNVAEGAHVGVGMPISVTFKRPIPEPERADVERLLKVTANPGVTGAWAWIKDRNLHDGQRVDFRPESYWKPGTKVSLTAGPSIARSFTVARSLVATVDVRSHTMTVVRDGEATRTIPITAGGPGYDTWNGTMVVSDKQRRVYMDSRTVDIADSYQGWYSYAVHLTTSGTYLHENDRANTLAGRSNVTHGCIGLASDGTARGFYEQVIPGDVIRVTNSKDTVAAGNGYGDWNLSWSEWRSRSAL
ncbi:lipoprotein-anchoring transpeptidase ErfK/SrfK [Streptomyces sp. SLBN-118]|uniref:L,D-transpeptidase n=1 Tax=Streptomyces sp. SLBN-118 TaxID=2768454 RepID=UPI00114E1166|nr:L,D-transpeptidase [Streptomyces sp. SLBN-118]TQK52682.1 lipoprotein-anchoring transpeptidase ErfK/SrfK [Streptomyces sp. SLBN-118]